LHDLDFLAVRKVRAEGGFSQLPRKGFRVSKALRGLSHITAGRAALRKYQKVGPLRQKGPLLLPSITEQFFFALRTGELGLALASLAPPSLWSGVRERGSTQFCDKVRGGGVNESALAPSLKPKRSVASQLT